MVGPWLAIKGKRLRKLLLLCIFFGPLEGEKIGLSSRISKFRQNNEKFLSQEERRGGGGGGGGGGGVLSISGLD